MRIRGKEFYVPRKNVDGLVRFLDLPEWRHIASEIMEFDICDKRDPDWDGWRDHRAHRIMVAIHSAPTDDVIEADLAFDPRDPVYIESCRKQDERLLIQEIKARHHGDFEFKVTPEMIAGERARQEEFQRIWDMEREARERAAADCIEGRMSAFDALKIRAVYDLAHALDIADACEFSADEIMQLRAAASPWSAESAERKRIEDKAEAEAARAENERMKAEANEKLRQAEELRRQNEEWIERRQIILPISALRCLGP
jgi:hypothetical protein